MKEYLLSIVDLKSGEGRIVGLMVLYNFILLVTLYLLKPVRDSLFLVELGPRQLPFVFILTALAVVPISIGYSRFSARVSMGWVINGITLFLAVNLVVIWWLIRTDSQILYFGFYIWVSIYSILITSQFWLLANALFDPMQAKRIFGLLSLSAIAGAMAGGEITGFLVDQAGVAPQQLLLVGAVILFGTLLLVWAIRKEADGTFAPAESSIESYPVREQPEMGRRFFNDIMNSRHLMLIIGIIAISVISTTIIDYQFKTVASAVYLTDERLTAFMGRFYGRVSIIALVLQLFLSTKFIERRGVGGAVTLLPCILLLGSVGLFIWTGLVAAVLLRGTDQSLKHSLDRTGRELLFIPVKMNLKKRTKVFIDLFVDNGAQGFAGLLLLLLTFQLTLSVQQISLVVIGLLACWIILAYWVQRSYVNEFRESVEKQVNNKQAALQQGGSMASMDQLVQNLQSHDEATVLRALESLRKRCDAEEMPLQVLERLLGHPDPGIRTSCLQLFRKCEIDGYIEEIARMIEDSSVAVRLEAARYIYHFYDAQRYEVDWLEILKEGLHHQDIKIRIATLGLIAKDGGREERALITTDYLEQAANYRGEHQKDLKMEVARVLGVVYARDRSHILMGLLQDSSPEVVQRAIIAAGRVGDRKFIHLLLDYLNSEKYRRTAQKGLAMYGDRILGTLFDYLTDDEVALSKRLLIPRILYLNDSQVALDVLQMGLDHCDIPVRHQVVKALSRMRQRLESPIFDEEQLKRFVYEEARRYALLRQSYSLLQRSDHLDELLQSIQEEAARSFENIFRLLGLIYDAHDIYNVYKGIRSENRVLVSESIEFLDNLIEWEIKKYLMPLFESLLSRQDDYGEFGQEMQSAGEALTYLSHLRHPVLHHLSIAAGREIV
ncbi:Npt1/Npt2 family nucleotide transporter [Fodinibius sediminis]|uniref:ADP,ATP carrier protein n=1 Tax=Fodinibius sediminis TaxID=1214077 RepID=A0A521BXN4_9BACT|nr:Npt1/Npt2 family nucleotide transporter [Fodinibius sediminis]SMO51795.1 ATP/ADP translocase [Fodinibius sediminis]